MAKYHVINMHFTDICNYNCTYCYAHNNASGRKKTIDEWKNLIDDIHDYFKREGIKEGRINLVGGEPLLFKELAEMIDYIYQKDITVSILTNGFYLTEEFIEKIANKVSMIGISIDSLNHQTNLKIGRSDNGKTLGFERIKELSIAIKKHGIIFKINVVVSQFNIHEDFSELFKECKPDRVKFLQVYIINSVNKKSEHLRVTDEEFKKFNNKYSATNPISESNSNIELGYIIVDSQGNFLINKDNEYIELGNIFEEKIYKLIKSIPYDLKNFNLRHIMVKTGLVFGRFQLLHKGHEEMFLQASKRAKNLIVGISNSNPYMHIEESSRRLIKQNNPFNFYERSQMVKVALEKLNIKHYTIIPFPIENLLHAKYYLPEDIKVFIKIYDTWGDRKLNMLTNHGFDVDVMLKEDISKKYQSATNLRNMIRQNDHKWREFVSKEIQNLIDENKYEEKIKSYG